MTRVPSIIAAGVVLLTACGDNDSGTHNNQNQSNQAVCGNGQLESGEACDQGVSNSDVSPDTCRTDCRNPWCGDGVLDASEVCDDGNGSNEDGCLSTCVLNVCGDGHVNRLLGGHGDPIEACDDGVNDGSPCRADCGQLMTDCGNGMIETGEECDDASGNSNIAPDACRTDCSAPSCGDGVTDSGETCDDGGANSDLPNANCRTDCQRARCGDGILDDGERCDDGNTDSGDGCRGDCQQDETLCDNGVLDAGEDCDGSLLGGAACADAGPYNTGALDCLASCTYDVSGCSFVGVCGDGTCSPDENAYSCPQDCSGAITCTEAAQLKSQFGCEFWPTPTSNRHLDALFDNNFGLLVYNPNGVASVVTVERDGVQAAQRNLPSGQYVEITLPINTGLQGKGGTPESKLVAAGAYHLTATAPISAFQFNPLEYQLDATHSYTNDAALLMPSHSLSETYVVLSRPGVIQGPGGESPSFVAIVGTAPSTSVDITFTAYTEAGTGPGGAPIQAYSPGDQATFVLGSGDVLQILSASPAFCPPGGIAPGGCDLGAPYDLTGTVIEATQPVAVFAGSDCAFVPFNTGYCDHLEQQLPPLEAWGMATVVSRTEPQTGAAFPEEPNVIRVVSGADGNQLSFSPAQPDVGASVTLHRGQWVEFAAGEDFSVTSTKPHLVGQLLVGGSNYSAPYSSYLGDPSFTIVPPVSQHRRFYAFMVPSTFVTSHINIVKPVLPTTATITLDGVPVPNIQFGSPIGNSDFASLRLSVSAGGHTIESTAPFQVTVYGFAPYTSYMYPAGMNVETLSTVADLLACTPGSGGCGATDTCCLTGCRDTTGDAQHCGGCFSACAPTETCQDSQCHCGADICVGTEVCCGTECVASFSSNDDHCGGCNKACDPADPCISGECSCGGDICEDGPMGQAAGCCSNHACIVWSGTNVPNCGGCDIPCSGTCLSGFCI